MENFLFSVYSKRYAVVRADSLEAAEECLEEKLEDRDDETLDVQFLDTVEMEDEKQELFA